MTLSGAKIAFLGDSITEGMGVTSPDRIYWGLLRDRCGIMPAVLAVCGTRIAPNREPSEDPAFDETFEERAERLPADTEAAVIFGGTNDYGTGDAPLGTPEDTEPDTFCGALRHLIRFVREKCPGAPVLVLTPVHRMYEEMEYYVLPDPHACGNLAAYVKSIRACAAAEEAAVLDLYAESGIDPRRPEDARAYTVDGLHLNDRGHEILFRLVRDALLEL
ncbi:MAG: SGNH/GDSL hydrolase family protein [Lachnospiraceae bacterium]|nr:SGNH/GDSL hydrolase family protein [Lachnospiraceae bacterium]